MTRPAILFVDDEAHVLSGLRRALSQRRDTWELHFAEGGAAALECLAAHRIDILVTDMRMPGMNGAELLNQVRRVYPTTVRIVLSGHADRDSIIAAAGSAQQFLSKPCDPVTLTSALESALASRDVLHDPGLRSLLGSLETVPKPAAIYTELTSLTGKPETTIGDVAHLVERDVATTTEMFKLVNSSFFGVAHEVTTISRAVTLLGLDVIQALVQAGQVFRASQELPADLTASDVASRGRRACLAVRRAATAEDWSDELTDQLCLAALLYDVGLLVLAAHAPGAWKRYLEVRDELPERDAQLVAFGCTIGQASAYLLGLWGFHPTVISTLAEQPIEPSDDVAPHGASRPGLAIAVAHQAAHQTSATERAS